MRSGVGCEMDWEFAVANEGKACQREVGISFSQIRECAMLSFRGNESKEGLVATTEELFFEKLFNSEITTQLKS